MVSENENFEVIRQAEDVSRMVRDAVGGNASKTARIIEFLSLIEQKHKRTLENVGRKDEQIEGLEAELAVERSKSHKLEEMNRSLVASLNGLLEVVRNGFRDIVENRVQIEGAIGQLSANMGVDAAVKKAPESTAARSAPQAVYSQELASVPASSVLEPTAADTAVVQAHEPAQSIVEPPYEDADAETETSNAYAGQDAARADADDIGIPDIRAERKIGLSGRAGVQETLAKLRNVMPAPARASGSDEETRTYAVGAR